MLEPQALPDEVLLSTFINCTSDSDPSPLPIDRILAALDISGGEPSSSDLKAIEGVSECQANRILAALEFARRRIFPRGTKIKDPRDVYPLVRHLADRPQEHFVAITLNGAHEVIALRVITIGLVDQSQVHPREVFCDAITDRASAIIVAHNHPSGSLQVSDQDLAVTKKLVAVGELVGIKVLDHVIFTITGMVSLKELGWVC